ncbi:hypothetical protein F5887DRAFT_962973 [Amanita rubescens]|nr:hypothetical protein F5887DRAFT_962973 [Amanita rubescens]
MTGPLRDFNDFSGYAQYPLIISSHCDARNWSDGGAHTSTKSSIPLYAPIQPRKYLTASATSRKLVPARFAKQAKAGKDQRGSSLEDELDELDELRDGGPELDPNLVEQIHERRRRNAISARNSRRRRLQQMEELGEGTRQPLKTRPRFTANILLRSRPLSGPAFLRPSSESFNVSPQMRI